jgi:Ca2+-binding RTX toxin-like protein
MKPTLLLATLGTAMAATFATSAAPANAAVTSASIEGGTATLNLDAADDNETISVANGVFVHTSLGGGLNSTKDWDSTTAGDQTVPADGTFGIDVNGGDGNDSITVIAKDDQVGGVKLSGDAGDDVLTGADSGDSLDGGDGNDRLIGGKGGDDMNGGAGNDTMVWNNGDGSDFVDGGDGNDTTEVNGSPTLGDAFKLAPDTQAGQVKFQRTNLGTFTIVGASERFQVNGLGGNDTVDGGVGTGARTLLSVDGGAGNDTVTGSDGSDLIVGGEGNDVLSGGAGDDRIVGDRGADTMNGGDGDDTLVWNNGDGTDVMNGDAGSDDVEVNGAPAAGDAFTVAPNGGRIKFNRTNLVPFSLDIGSSETMHANGLGGDDTIAIGEVGGFAVTAAGGSGNDTITDGGSGSTLLGGSGNDSITAGGGIDVVSAGDGDDHVNVRDQTADVATGGAGNDSVVADDASLDVLDGFEQVDRTQVITPAPVDTSARPVIIKGGTLKVSKGKVAIKVSAPAGSGAHSTGLLQVRTAKSVKLAGVKAVLQLGSARFDVAPGTSRTLKVKLAKGVQRLADRKGRIKVLLVATNDASRNSNRHAKLALSHVR